MTHPVLLLVIYKIHRGNPFTQNYFVFPLISHQIWCFLIPSCHGEQRTKYNRFLH
ncbi:hypothetical protein HanPI659440_Chr02g0047821 [Helianthus annuus]|nr:hypothetical protein HanPI659440_Chr02g0047821 [Helianthus annuus]